MSQIASGDEVVPTIPVDTHTGDTLDTLIAPTDASAFFREYWERRPLHVPSAQRDRFTHLFASSDVDELLGLYGRTHTLGVRLSRHSNGRTEIVDLAAEQSLVDLDRVLSAYAQGFTININDLEERRQPIRALAASLAAAFGCMVKVNAYVTPAQAAAFPLHLDTHDVLILQIEGTKAWRVYAPCFPSPTKMQRPPTEIPKDAVGSPLIDVVLQAGDVLYVPRGFGHEVFTQGDASLHLTVGIHAFTFVDLIETALGVMAWDAPQLRRAIPARAITGDAPDAAVEADLRALRAMIAERLPLEEALTRLAAQWLAWLPPSPHARFGAGDPVDSTTIGPDTVVRRRSGTPCRIVEGYGWMSIQYPSHGVTVPARMREPLEYIAQTDEFAVASVPGRLSDDERVALVQRLITEGLLVRADHLPERSPAARAR